MKLSDHFEINKAVAELKGISIPEVDGVQFIKDGNCIVATDMNGGTNRKYLFPDYCNSPDAAWPIIAETEIDIEWPTRWCDTGTVTIYIPNDTDIFEGFNDKSEVFAAAMLCFIRIKEEDGVWHEVPESKNDAT